MASVFLSYDREDAPRARSVAQALAKAGHSVWWDRQIAGGAEYGTEIEEALARAEAVVVLWSEHAVRSAWVRDEAAAGRDAGKLVPARLDATDPPMGFRQYQTVDLSRWKGGKAGGPLKDLDRAIQGVAGKQSRPQRPIQAPASTFIRRPSPRVLAGALAVVAFVAAAWFAAVHLMRPGVPVVAVAAADSRPASQQLTRDLFVKLGMLPQQGDLGMRTVEARNASKDEFDFLIEIGASTTSAAGANLVLLSGEKRALLWSKDFELPANRRPDLKEQAAYSAARVLSCAMEARNAGIGIDDSLTKRYLEGCSMLAEFAGVFVRPALPAFREITRKRPDFEEGWSKLLLTETQTATGESRPNSSGYPEIQRLIAGVRNRFPNNPAAYYAEIETMPISATTQRLALSEKAVQQHPENSFLLQQRAMHLFRVGRVQEATEHAWRASEADPLSAKMRSDFIAVLAYGGLIDRAYQELAKAEKLWPGTFAALDANSRVHQRFGDPKRALNILRSGVFGDDPAMEAFLLARIDPTPANIDKAIAETKAMFGRDPRALGFYMQALGAFGKERELYEFFARWDEVLPVGTSATGTAGVLFRAPLHKFRQDPRFMQVAARFGILDYWRKSGRWPDFCFEPDLPYDCKAEAAKLS